MDLDAYVSAHEGQWKRLDELLRQRRLTAAESDELLDLYQRVSTHLSVVRSASPDPTLVRSLSALLTRARAVTGGQQITSRSDIADFFWQTFPAVLYRLRWWWGITAIANVVVAFLVALWTLQHPEAYASVLSRAEIDQLVNSDFENYYSEYAHHEFATLVWVNNAWVAAQCIAFGVVGFPVIWVLWGNIFNVGVTGALMAANDRTDLFFGLILPHGLLELTAVFVAAGTGLSLFWSWISPGARTRGQSFAHAGRTTIVVVLGLIIVLLISGIIEGFVTPSDLPTWARIGIGVVAELAFLAYVFVIGRAAVQRGVTGDQSTREIGDEVPVAA